MVDGSRHEARRTRSARRRCGWNGYSRLAARIAAFLQSRLPI
ncbi:hypothetical protein [Lysobacter gummosus]